MGLKIVILIVISIVVALLIINGARAAKEKAQHIGEVKLTPVESFEAVSQCSTQCNECSGASCESTTCTFIHTTKDEDDEDERKTVPCSVIYAESYIEGS